MRRISMLYFASAAAAVGLLAGCSTNPTVGPVDTAKVSDEVKSDATALVAAFNARDAEKSVSFDAPDYVGMMHGAPNVSGPAGDLALTKQQIADPASKFQVSGGDVSVAAAGDRAMYQSTYAYTFTDPATKSPKTENGNWLLGFRKQTDGSWKIKWSVISDTGPAPASTAASPA